MAGGQINVDVVRNDEQVMSARSAQAQALGTLEANKDKENFSVPLTVTSDKGNQYTVKANSKEIKAAVEALSKLPPDTKLEVWIRCGHEHETGTITVGELLKQLQQPAPAK